MPPERGSWTARCRQVSQPRVLQPVEKLAIAASEVQHPRLPRRRVHGHVRPPGPRAARRADRAPRRSRRGFAALTLRVAPRPCLSSTGSSCSRSAGDSRTASRTSPHPREKAHTTPPRVAGNLESVQQCDPRGWHAGQADASCSNRSHSRGGLAACLRCVAPSLWRDPSMPPAAAPEEPPAHPTPGHSSARVAERHRARPRAISGRTSGRRSRYARRDQAQPQRLPSVSAHRARSLEARYHRQVRARASSLSQARLRKQQMMRRPLTQYLKSRCSGRRVEPRDADEQDAAFAQRPRSCRRSPSGLVTCSSTWWRITKSKLPSCGGARAGDGAGMRHVVDGSMPYVSQPASCSRSRNLPSPQPKSSTRAPGGGVWTGTWAQRLEHARRAISRAGGCFLAGRCCARRSSGSRPRRLPVRSSTFETRSRVAAD